MYMYRENDGSEERGVSDRFKTGQVYARLKHLLVSQKVPPHTKLDAGILAQRLSMSRTPVREALIHLAIEDVILNIPGSGYFSKPLNVEEIAEDYDLALTILRHVIDADMEMVRKVHLGLPKFPVFSTPSADHADIALLFKDFIEELYEGVAKMAGNRKYQQVVHAFNSRTGLVRYLDLQRPDRFTQIADDMGELVELLDRRQAKGAIANLNRQFKSKIDILYELVKEGNLRSANASANWLNLLD
ncbi:GntR family transcriptional regulator [Rhizobium terrae]|uniref:GntR family transcriptional regulator n=1 Tax=Rhizobium terrae TaxID=2171756 RepID=UPI000E3E0996|nr:GntR family transcriptional regulator [Rhizobium terrae]